MERVQFGKHWEINSKEDYDNAIKFLEDAYFRTAMSSNYKRARRECPEIVGQITEVTLMAFEKGFR